jgi:sarcosine oxidase subunit alpha
MDRLGGWWRPWTYGDVDAEYRAVREAVSIGDVGTLGKFFVSGPDAEAALQRIFPTDVSTIRPGRSRYVLMLDERGYVLDDGMILRETEGDRFYVTVTSGGASVAEMWVRDWTAHLDVRWLNATMSLGAINVTGPRATELMERAGLAGPLPMLRHTHAEIADVPCRVVRLSFTGETSYELHHPFARSPELWRALLDLGADLDIAPHGLDALTRLRLEKGHLIVGQDTDYDSTPRRLDHDWMVNLDSGGDFVGRQAVERTNRIPLDKMLVGLQCVGDAPFEGAVAWRTDGEYAGYVTSSTWSPTLDRGVMLAWIRTVDGEVPETVVIEGREARRVELPFYDPTGARARG